ncbi:MAG: GTPase domain-containing protein [Candidatus Lokiarchaeota archaeon]|nr:GTPase domain-containing protein [Candidatus Harpocratesius repetitus]
MLINYKKKEIQIKIVYYGCAMSGKTTSLKNLFRSFNREDLLTSIETTTGRTLFFDFGVLQLKGGEWIVKISLLTATGQDFYASTRPATLYGIDGIMFVVDSQRKYFNDNLSSWNELNFYLQEKISDLPIVICLNKQDLDNLISLDEINQHFQLNSLSKVQLIPTIAIDNRGIIEAFKYILEMIFPSIIVK